MIIPHPGDMVRLHALLVFTLAFRVEDGDAHSSHPWLASIPCDAQALPRKKAMHQIQALKLDLGGGGGEERDSRSLPLPPSTIGSEENNQLQIREGSGRNSAAP